MNHYHREHNRKSGRCLALLLLIILLFLAGVLYYRYKLNPADTFSDSYHSIKNDLQTSLKDAGQDKLEITMLDVGQGLSLLISCDGESMLYDGGPSQSSSYLVSYLKQHDITHLRYILASHYDEDHIAGLVGVLSRYTVDTALTPDYQADTNIYQSFRKKLKSNGAVEIHPAVGDSYSLGGAELTVLAPDSYTAEDDNNSSIILRLTYGDFSCLMTGDAEAEEEAELVNSGQEVESVLYVAGHHGSATSSGDALLRAVSPQIVFLSVGAENSYGHPAESTMSRLKKAGIALYRTDLQGEVSVETDGSSWTYSTDACQDWSSGTLTILENESKSGQEASDRQLSDTQSEENKAKDKSSEEASSGYILNKNTMKFHNPTCSSVAKMKEKNKIYSQESREELIREGYDPCGNCKP